MPADLDHPHLTTAGLLVEAVDGLSAQLEAQLEAHRLSPQWFGILLRLARSPGQRLRMAALAAQTTLSASGLTRAIDRLEAAGLVQRESCPSDRRGAFAVLTPEGEARIDAALPVHLGALEAVFDGHYSPGELEALTELLRRLRDAVNPAAACASDPEEDDARSAAQGAADTSTGIPLSTALPDTGS
jgi:MarR family 2-MHQ and catechol resistance regulon transcriptional repressor